MSSIKGFRQDIAFIIKCEYIHTLVDNVNTFYKVPLYIPGWKDLCLHQVNCYKL